MLPIQPGDVERTWANVDDLINDYGYSPNTSINYGVKAFVDWYKSYYLDNLNTNYLMEKNLHSYINYKGNYEFTEKICYDCGSTKKVLHNSYSLGNCRHMYKFKIWCC